MVTIKSFQGIRPAPEYAAQLAARPYDVLDSDEAREEVKGNPYSFLRVTKPEVAFPRETDVYSDAVYDKGKEVLDKFLQEGVLRQDDHACLYIYAQEMNGRRQTGLVAASSIDDYFGNRIKKHELTRQKKEEDRIRHTATVGVNPGPVFLTYKRNLEIDRWVRSAMEGKDPEYDFIAVDGIRHILWKVDDEYIIEHIIRLFREQVPCTYIADGHHRSAASAKVGQQLREKHGGSTTAPYNYFLSVLFPDSDLNIIDYNRLVRDLNSMSLPELLERIREHFDLEECGDEECKPTALHEFALYAEGKWYRMKAKPHTYTDKDAVGVLDVSILTDYVLAPILGIRDQRTDERIDFVGGIRGLKELKRRVDNGEMKAAFALYPVSIQQLIDIADSGQIMPPKSTWFEPKLRSGLVIYKFS